jgi:hypothetical protein
MCENVSNILPEQKSIEVCSWMRQLQTVNEDMIPAHSLRFFSYGFENLTLDWIWTRECHVQIVGIDLKGQLGVHRTRSPLATWSNRCHRDTSL